MKYFEFEDLIKKKLKGKPKTVSQFYDLLIKHGVILNILTVRKYIKTMCERKLISESVNRDLHPKRYPTKVYSLTILKK